MEKILLYYRYTPIANPAELAAWQRTVCTNLGLFGRILIAPEGINGTVSGPLNAIEAYKTALRDHPLFTNIDIKEEDAPTNCFPRLQITIKKHIVNFGALTDVSNSGTHVTPQHAHELIKNKADDVVIFDARNAYESRVGKFDHAITPSIENFRDLAHYFDTYEDTFKNKRVLLYCTGGIRCEIASAYLQEKQIAKEVMQIEGGIINYVQQYPNGFFRGKNYVFDGRVTVPITADVLTECDSCQAPYDEYTHCLNAMCNKQIIACPACIKAYNNCCSTACQELLATGKTHARPAFKRAF